MEHLYLPSEELPQGEDAVERFVLDDEEVEVVASALGCAAAYLNKAPKKGYTPTTLALVDARVEQYLQLLKKINGD
jgi:hypothetical protein